MEWDIKISVIVPIYNVENYVEKCVNSIMNQSYKNLEIILVDDGSSDKSGTICDKLGENDSRIRVIHKLNEGLVSARKTGAGVATGDYMASVDGDDWIDETYIESFVCAIRTTRCDVAWDISMIKEYEDRRELNMPRTMKNLDIGREECQKYLYDCVCGVYGYQNDIDYSICSLCVRRDVYVEIQNLVDNRITRGEDLVFSIVLLSKNNSISFIRNDGYHYVQRDTSYTYNTAAYSKDTIHVLKEYFSKCWVKSETNVKSLQNQVKGYIISTYMLQSFGSMQNSEMDYLYPFSKIKKGDNIILYGAGSIGKNMVSFLADISEYNIVAWVDGKKNGKSVLGKWNIRSVDEIRNISYDYIILATNRTMYIREMREQLTHMGVDNDKIVSPFDDLKVISL